MTPLSGETALTTPGSARILQLSDTHLMAESGGRLVGIDTDQSLAAVCRLIAKQERVDALLITGDLAGDESEKAYERLRSEFEAVLKVSPEEVQKKMDKALGRTQVLENTE